MSEKRILYALFRSAEVFQGLTNLQTLRGHKREDLAKGDICELLFRHRKTQRSCRVFLEWLKKNHQEVAPGQLSHFVHDLQAGKIVKGFRYRHRNFYHTILKRLMELGFISRQPRFPNRVVYAPIIQPIPKRAPLLTTWWGFAYLIAEKWNQEFGER